MTVNVSKCCWTAQHNEEEEEEEKSTRHCVWVWYISSNSIILYKYALIITYALSTFYQDTYHAIPLDYTYNKYFIEKKKKSTSLMFYVRAFSLAIILLPVLWLWFNTMWNRIIPSLVQGFPDNLTKFRHWNGTKNHNNIWFLVDDPGDTFSMHF